MINKSIEQITKDDLQALIDNEVIEHKTIEYKRELPGNSDKEKKEFLADVTSFANASGGDIVYGLIEDRRTGKPKSLDGLSIENPDQEVLRLEGIIRTGVQPRIPSVMCSKPIQIKDDKIALIIRVQKSWISPHRVTLGGHDKFYSRSSNGKYSLDVGELRIAFNLSESISERIRNFRADRIAKIIASETPVQLCDNPKIVIHLIPINSFSSAQSYDVNIIASNIALMPTIYSGGSSLRYNLDGILTYSRGEASKSTSYTQLFRNGILEGVESTLLEPHEGQLIIPSVAFENALIRSMTDYLAIFKLLHIQPPVFIFLTLLNVKGYYLAVNRRFWGERFKIDRDMLEAPENIVENYDINAAQLMRTCFDSIWNACGFQRDFYYNEQGEWKPG